MRSIHKVLHRNQVVEVTDFKRRTFKFVVKYFVVGYRILCEPLDGERPQLAAGTGDVEIKAYHGSGEYVIPARLASVSGNGKQYRFVLGKRIDYTQRRQHVRLDNPQITAVCRVNKKLVSEAAVTDISVGGIGLLIKADMPLKKDSTLDLRLTLPNGSEVKAIAKATHLSELKDEDYYKVGARFLGLVDEDRVKIVQAIVRAQIAGHNGAGGELAIS